MLALPSVAAAKDRNHDRIPDRWEKRHRLSLNVNQARRDQDGDQLRNRGEFLAGDNPRKADSDGDGITDGEENAGTIASFDTDNRHADDRPLRRRRRSAAWSTKKPRSSAARKAQLPRARARTTRAPARKRAINRARKSPATNRARKSLAMTTARKGSPGMTRAITRVPGNGGDNGNEGNCTTADLVPGAVVDEAELRLSNGTATFEKVELGS